MIDYILTALGQIPPNCLLAYLAIGLITLLMLIRIWINDNDGSYEGIEESMTTMALLSLIGWPYIFVVWVLGWPVFSWSFWLKKCTWKFWFQSVCSDAIAFKAWDAVLFWSSAIAAGVLFGVYEDVIRAWWGA